MGWSPESVNKQLVLGAKAPPFLTRWLELKAKSVPLAMHRKGILGALNHQVIDGDRCSWFSLTHLDLIFPFLEAS